MNSGEQHIAKRAGKNARSHASKFQESLFSHFQLPPHDLRTLSSNSTTNCAFTIINIEKIRHIAKFRFLDVRLSLENVFLQVFALSQTFGISPYSERVILFPTLIKANLQVW